MAATEAMGVTLRAEFRDFEKQLLKARNDTDTKLANIAKNFEKANAKVKAESRGMAGAFGDLTKGIPGLSGGMGALGLAGGAAALGVGALVTALNGVKSAAKFADELTATADRIGVTAEALQELRFAADETDVPIAALEQGLEQLNASLGAFKTGIGAGRITPIFEALGLTQEDLAGIENARDLLPILADRLGQVSDRATQVQLAKKLGIESLLPLLRKGSGGIEAMSGQARDLGLVLSNDVVNGLAETDRALERNQQQIDANVREMQASMAPFFVWASGELAKLARGIGDLFNGLRTVQGRTDRVLEGQVESLQEKVNFATRMARDTGRPMSRVQEGWVRELAAARGELTTRRRARAAEAAPSAADRAREGGFEIERPDAPPTRAGGGGGSRRGPSGPSPADLARQRELLMLQQSIELLRAQGRDEEARTQQTTLDVLELTARYEAAGIAGAREQAQAHVDAITAAQRAAEGLVLSRTAEATVLEWAAEAQAELVRQTSEELGYRAELARLEGDPAAIAQMERALYINQRTNDLLRERAGLITAAQARGIAADEYDQLGEAERLGKLRDGFRESFREGIRAAIDGDLGSFFDNLADRFTDRMLDNLANQVFDLLNRAMKAGEGGDSFWAAIGNAASGGFGGGKTAGVSGGPKGLEGFATGGSFKVGGSGAVDSQVMAFRATPGEMVDIRKPGQFPETGRSVNFDLRGAVMTKDLLQQMERMAAQSGGMAVDISRAVVPSDESRRRRFNLSGGK